MQKIYWDNYSLFIYLIQAIIGMLCFRACVRDVRTLGMKRILMQPYSLIVLVIWTFLASFRGVGWGLGGMDAETYVNDYIGCLKTSSMSEHATSDLLFLWFQQLLRRFTSDYHLFFFISYGFIVASFILFIKRFTFKFSSFIPFVLAFYLYLRGYNTLRSNLAIACTLIGLVNIANSQYKWAYLFMICACFVHKGCILSALSIPYLHVVIKKSVKYRYIVAMGFILFISAATLRDLFISYASTVDLGGAYGSYASMAKENNGWMSGFTENLMQYLLAIIVLLSISKIRRVMIGYDEKTNRTVNILLYICFFDMMLIPFNVMLGIWRGYEFFYVPRLCMWSVIIFAYIGKMHRHARNITQIILFFGYISWFIFRLSRTYTDSALMPYVLDCL